MMIFCSPKKESWHTFHVENYYRSILVRPIGRPTLLFFFKIKNFPTSFPGLMKDTDRHRQTAQHLLWDLCVPVRVIVKDVPVHSRVEKKV